MNRGSNPKDDPDYDPEKGFNEAPIHESGKCTTVWIICTTDPQLQ